MNKGLIALSCTLLASTVLRSAEAPTSEILDEDTTLCSAAESGQTNLINLLLTDPGVEVNDVDPDSGNTPLTGAIFNGKLESVSALLSDKHVDVNKTDSRGMSPIHCILFQYQRASNSSDEMLNEVKNNAILILEALIAHNDIDINQEWRNRSALAYARETEWHEAERIITDRSLKKPETPEDKKLK